MKTRQLGRTGIRVSEIGTGLWAAGGDQWGPTDDREVLNAIERSLGLGVNFYDTADVYGNGHSEELLGRAMKGRREKFVVATKIGWIGYNGAAGHSGYGSADAVVKGVELNLRRLGTDFVDLIQCHIGHRESTMENFLEGFRLLRQSGKARAFGVSTSDFSYLRAFNASGDCGAVQVDYSILNRTPEKDVLPYCLEKGLGVIVRGGLAMGLLTGKFGPSTTFPQGDFRKNWLTDPEQNRTFLEDLAKVDRLKKSISRPLIGLALKFCLARPEVSTVIPGAKTARQVETNAAVSESPALTAEEKEIIAEVTPASGGRKIWPA
jgi:aryl-alcohol dehydrogenase-like predicted oxidoreductase